MTTQNKGGRPSKLTEALCEEILKHVRNGIALEMAAARAGVGRTTFYLWLRLGAADPKGEYGAFKDALEQAEAECYVTWLNAVIAIAAREGDANVILKVMERRFPEFMGAPEINVRVRGKLEADRQADLERLCAGLDQETYRRVVELLADEGAGEEGTEEASRTGKPNGMH